MSGNEAWSHSHGEAQAQAEMEERVTGPHRWRTEGEGRKPVLTSVPGASPGWGVPAQGGTPSVPHQRSQSQTGQTWKKWKLVKDQRQNDHK